MALTLDDAVRMLNSLAPMEFAEAWDNVGLLVEASGSAEVHRALLAIDLTPSVLSEAESRGADLVVAYHPPIFKPLTRVRASDPREGVVARALAKGIAVYSPHTALDAAPDGVNDWLAEAFGEGERAPLVPALAREPLAELKLVVFVPRDSLDAVRSALAGAGAGQIGNYSECSFGLEGTGTFFGNEASDPSVGQAGRLEHVAETRLEMVCSRRALPAIASALSAVHPYEEPAWDVYPLSEKPKAGFGMGRGITLGAPVSLAEATARIKQHLGLSHVRVATAERHAGGEPIRRVAVCAGSGGSLFERAPGCDLYLTGELRHHDVLAHVARGSSVVLCDHSNTERGYLARYKQRIEARAAGRLEALISEADREPLSVA